LASSCATTAPEKPAPIMRKRDGINAWLKRFIYFLL
jgi:hypothetical protein